MYYSRDIKSRKSDTPKLLPERIWRNGGPQMSWLDRRSSMHVAENVYFSMAKEKTSFELQEKLKDLYEKKSSTLKLILIRQLFHIQMKETEEATTHINTFIHALTQLSSQNLNFDEEVKALVLLSTLPASWDRPVTNRSPKLTLDDTVGLVLSEELQRKSIGLSIEETT